MKQAILISILLISFSGRSQSWYNRDTLKINFNIKLYEKIARDSIASIYDAQKLEKVVDDKNHHYLSNLYKLEDVSIKCIPIFRIDHYAFIGYDCSKSFENFIVFEERNKFQYVILNAGDKEWGMLAVPDKNYLMDIFYAGEDFVENSEQQLNRLDLNSLSNSKHITSKMAENPENFFFKIMGFDDYLFDIDNKSGKMYAQYIGYSGGVIYDNQNPAEVAKKQKLFRTRALVNEYILNNVTQEFIKSLAVNQYVDDWDYPKIKYETKDCGGVISKARTILVN